jgi:hypothetical protein
MAHLATPPPFTGPVCVAEERQPSRLAGLTPRSQLILGACLCGAAATFLYAVDPMQHHVYPVCAFHQVTGFYCAGCGATRALHALLHGRILDALHDNLLVIGLLPFALYFVLKQLRPVWRDNTWNRFHIPVGRVGWGAGLVLVLFIGFILLRNLPGWPFALLRPLGG